MLTNIGAALAAATLLASDTGRTRSGLWYSVTGAGPTVMFLHGSNLDSRAWGPLPAALAADHRVILTDLRSHGRSLDATGPFSWVDDAVEVLDAVGATRAALIGHSLGAQIVIDLSLSHPERVTSLVVIGPAISGRPLTKPPAGFEGMVAALRRGDFAAAGEALAAMPVMTLYRDTAGQAEIRAIVKENVRLFRADRTWVKGLDPPAAGRLGELKIPVAILLGSADPTESNEAGQVLQAQVPRATSTVLPRCGHLVPVDCGPEASRAVRAFLARTP